MKVLFRNQEYTFSINSLYKISQVVTYCPKFGENDRGRKFTNKNNLYYIIRLNPIDQHARSIRLEAQ